MYEKYGLLCLNILSSIGKIFSISKVEIIHWKKFYSSYSRTVQSSIKTALVEEIQW